MFGTNNDYRKNREALGEQYINAWRTEEGFARHDTLCERFSAYYKTVKHLPLQNVKKRQMATDERADKSRFNKRYLNESYDI